MLLHVRMLSHLVGTILVYAIVLAPSARAQGTGDAAKKQRPRPAAAAPAALSADEADAGETRERRSMERFLSLLEKNPRRGTPLDRVYGYHVERGSLDEFIKSYRDRLDKKPDDGAAWLILGLLEFQRGQDAAAVTAHQTSRDSPSR